MEYSIYCFVHQPKNTFNLLPDSIINELDFFSIVVESDYELTDHYVVITDIPIELSFISKEGLKYRYGIDEYSVRQYFQSQDFDRVFEIYKKSVFLKRLEVEINFYKLFLNYPIGTCEIALVDKNNLEQLATFVLNVSSSKIDSVEFESLVSYVESKGNSIWTKFSLIKHHAESVLEIDRLDWLLLFCDNFIKELENKYLGYFITDKITTLINYSQIENYDENVLISEDSIAWLLGNLDVLNPTTSYDLHKIIIKNRAFVPKELLSNKLQDTTDNSENQLFHGFIDELLFFISEVSVLYKYEISILGKERFEDVVMFYAYTRKLKDIDQLRLSLVKIKQFLIDELPVSKVGLDFLSVNKIQSKEHYYFVYDKLLKWLLYKGANYSISNRFFKGISRLDELFERACYYQLFDAFLLLGFEPILEIDSDVQNGISTKQSFVKDNKRINLYYQGLPDSLTTIKKFSNNLTPDFIIELEDSTYIILDAKYKKLKNIERYDYTDLSLKYLHGIGPKKGGRLNAIALLVLFPDNEKVEGFYVKDEFSIRGSNTIYPIIGSIAISFGERDSLLIPMLQDIF